MKYIIVSLLALYALTVACLAKPEPKREVKKGNLLYNKGKFEEALKQYEGALLVAPDSDIVNFDLGAALYKTEDHEAAINHFEKSLVSDNETLEQNASYNLGNAEYKYGISKEDSDLEGAIGLLKKALGHYEHAIILDPEDEDAKYNYEFVKKELERLEKKMKEEKEDKGEEGEEQEEDKGKEGRGKGEDKEKQDEQDTSGQEEQDKGKEGREQEKKTQEERERREEERKKQEDKRREEEREKQEEERKRREEERRREGDSEAGRGQAGEAQEMSEDEAAMLLEHYRHGEEPKGLYKEKIETRGMSEVMKDW